MKENEFELVLNKLLTLSDVLVCLNVIRDDIKFINLKTVHHTELRKKGVYALMCYPSSISEEREELVEIEIETQDYKQLELVIVETPKDIVKFYNI